MPARSPSPVRYAFVGGTPVGTLLLARTERGLVTVTFGERRDALLAKLRGRFGGDPIAEGGLERETAALRAYFDGRLDRFDLPLDLEAPRATEFERAVWRATERVGFGRLTTYGALASAIGKPGAARAVGNALGKNPLAIVVPCHRVVASGGGIGGYTGGLRHKRTLLAIEGLRVV